MAHRKSIRVSPDEERLLTTMYYEALVPSDQYSRRPGFLRRFTAVWNEATGRSDSPGELVHWIVTRRKRPKGRPGRLEALGEGHKCMRSPGQDALTPEQWEVLDDLYRELNVGSDNFVFDEALADRLVEMFFERTGVHIPAILLVAALIARRKDGFLGRLDPNDPGGEDRDLGFGDIDEVA